MDFLKDTFLDLPALDKQITSMGNRHHASPASDFQPSSALNVYDSRLLPAIPSLASSHGDYCVYNLAAFERWVKRDLESWLESSIRGESTCALFGQAIEDYFLVSSGAYCGNPDSISIIVLTITELWSGCDRSVRRSALFCSIMILASRICSSSLSFCQNRGSAQTLAGGGVSLVAKGTIDG